MTRNLGLLLVLLVAVVYGDTLYLSSTGVDTTECSKNSPCGDMQTVLAVFGDSADDLTVDVEEGVYGGDSNYNIVFPDVPVTVQSSSSNCTFTCGDRATHTCFIAMNEFTVESIIFDQCQLGIRFNGTEFKASSVNFSSLTSGIAVTNVTSFTVEDSVFDQCTQGIALETLVTMTKLEISNTDFSTSGTSSFSLENSNDVEAKIDSVTVNQCISAYAFTISNGNWELTDITASNSSSVVNFTGSGNYTKLEVENLQVDTSLGGVYFNALAPVEIKESTFTVSETAIEIDSATTIEIKENNFYNATNPLSIAIFQTVILSVEDCEFEFTGSVAITLIDNSNATIQSCTFKNAYLPVILNGGMWGIYDSQFYDDIAMILISSGGELNLNGSGASYDISGCSFEGTSVQGDGGSVFIRDAAVGFTGCTIQDNYASGYGGAVYASNPSALSFQDTTFTSNTALMNGGGLSIDAEDTLEVYLDNVVFDDNSATTGAAASCCANSAATCNITLVYDSDKSVSLANNVNTEAGGSDITCTTSVGDFVSAATEPDVDLSSSGLDWWAWVLISLSIVFFLAILIGVAAVVVWKVKSSKSGYTVA